MGGGDEFRDMTPPTKSERVVMSKFVWKRSVRLTRNGFCALSIAQRFEIGRLEIFAQFAIKRQALALRSGTVLTSDDVAAAQ